MAQQNIAMQDPSFHNAELRESEERYRTLFESIDEGFCIIEKIEGETGEALDFRFVEANPAFAALTGLSGVVGRTLRQVFPDEFEERILTYDTILRTGEPIRFEREFVTQGRMLELYAFRVADQTHRRVAINFHDITGRQQAEEALRQRTAQFETLLNEAPVGVLLIDGDFRISQANPVARRVWPAMPELIGRNFDEFMHILWPKALADEIVEQYRHTLATGKPFVVPELVEERIDQGRKEYYEWQINRIPLPDGGYGVVCYFRDISERVLSQQKIRESEERLRLAAEAAHFGMYDRDMHGAYIHISGQLKQILGYEPYMPLDHAQIMSHMHPDDRLAGAAAFQRACDPAGDGRIAAEQRIVRRDGAVRWIATVGRVLFEDGAPRRSIGFWIDITQRKAAELALRAANIDLERRVEERTRALADKARQLERASRVKSEFLASMSHELRTPLNGIIGFTEFLHDEKPGPLLPKQKEYLNDVLDSARHLLKLINEVLDIAKVEAGKIELHPSSFSVTQAIEEARTVIQGSADKKRIAMRIEVGDGLDAVTLDPLRFRQVLYNLLSNAVKFSDEGGRVEIHARRLAPNQLEVQVRDTGIGIKAVDLGRLFTEFGRLDSGATRRAEGTGLGLALTKKLVELQGGRIGVRSVAGEGSVFTVVLPLVTGQADEGRAS